ncbi:cyclopropane-fatty-acyl-phospholipid synthase family protein [Nocardiopsis sp. MG754419]|uniref:SAM-dependent methyltransferase n=1 Tax=Nocardiopsis sp. MG754419 TaxID=2259865 RepID=UPI001BACA635|nr:class I SAM-dependent methyltransferase [Nocardiopsis sp. MG754419]MBR8742107.1 class I SAM-dependent methyltransferase [Nocardiopsis sp. MG754419]
MTSEHGVASPAREFWERHYGDDDPSTPRPAPNAAFVALAEDLPLVPPPGARSGAPRALELACGRGGDALWLATTGWHVTAVDVSDHVLAVLAERARRSGIADRLDVQGHDLERTLPGLDRWDLVYANYFHPTTDLDRNAVLRRVSRSVADGGRLVVLDHGSTAPWSWNRDAAPPTAEDLRRSLALDGSWTVEVCERRTRLAHGPDGRTATVIDNVVVARRHPGA